jgi:hypothetical protein
MLCQQANPSIIFLCCSRAEDSQRFQQRCGKPLSIFMPSHSVQSKAKPAAALQLRYSFIFLIDEVRRCFTKSNLGLVMLSPSPQVLLYFED